MTETLQRIFLPLSFVLGCLFVFYHVISGRASSNGYMYLAALIGLEILLMSVWNFRERFLPILLITFLCAGVGLPFISEACVTARWGVLAAGAMAGFVLYMRDPSHKFGVFHLMALFSVITALVSALVSNYPQIALLKTASLLLVFFYAGTGARLAIAGREAKFCSRLLLGCEILVYVSAFFYYALRWPIYGNPNSLGIVMGVAACPILLWGVIVSEGTRSYKRRVFALALCLLLLFSSYARAALGAAFLTSLLLCVTLRRYRLFMKGIAFALLGAMLVMVVAPLRDAHSTGGLMDRLADAFVYKGKEEQGLWGSRQSPWEVTSASIRDHPWFGTGFGTSVTAVEGRQQQALSATSVLGATREHGTSYLAIVEWTGLFGVIPFYFLVLATLVNVCRVFLWARRTANPFSPAIPIAAVLAGALFHANFEDWMFAVGYYMCIFFWSFAFMLPDLIPAAQPALVPAPHLPTISQWTNDRDAVLLGR